MSRLTQGEHFFLRLDGYLLSSISMTHVDHIHRLTWRPSVTEAVRELASCSEDGTMRILKIRLTMD